MRERTGANRLVASDFCISHDNRNMIAIVAVWLDVVENLLPCEWNGAHLGDINEKRMLG
jgi:hypothetical protein